MLKLARWSTTHRKYVLLGWVVLLLGVNLLAHSAGTKYSNNFTLPHSDAQRASDLLKRSFPAQAGDRALQLRYRLADGHRRGPVEHHPHSPLGAVHADQHHRAPEVGVQERGRGEQQLAGERFHHLRLRLAVRDDRQAAGARYAEHARPRA